MTTLFCPDCGAKCELVQANPFGNQWCFTCSDPECGHHWVRFFMHVDYVRESECEICHDHSESLKCSLCNLPSESGWVHGDCARREQALADRE